MSTSTVSYVIWGALLVVGLVLWSLSYRRASSAARPSEVITWVSTHPVFRVCLVGTVMFLGWHLFAR